MSAYEMHYGLGHQVITRSNRKSRRVETVIDFLETRNLSGEIVNTEYVLEHDFLGQTIKTMNCRASIAMGETIKEVLL